MRRLLLQPPLSSDVLSLEEILAEGVEEEELDEDDVRARDPPSPAPQLCKARMKGLQQAAYYSAEHGFLDVTLDLREMGERHRNCTLETFNDSFAILVCSHGGGGLISISHGGRRAQTFTYLYLRASDTNTEKVAMSTDCRSLDSGTNTLSVRSRALFSVTPQSVPPVQVSPGGSTPGCSPSLERGGSAGTERSCPSSRSSLASRRRTTPPSSSPQVCRCSSTCWRAHRYEQTPL